MQLTGGGEDNAAGRIRRFILVALLDSVPGDFISHKSCNVKWYSAISDTTVFVNLIAVPLNFESRVQVGTFLPVLSLNAGYLGSTIARFVYLLIRDKPGTRFPVFLLPAIYDIWILMHPPSEIMKASTLPMSICPSTQHHIIAIALEEKQEVVKLLARSHPPPKWCFANNISPNCVAINLW